MRRQRHHLSAVSAQKRAGANQKGIRFMLGESSESYLDLARVSDFDNDELLSYGVRRLEYFPSF